MTSPRRRQDRPVESVELRITFTADRQTSARIKELIPNAVVRGRTCEVRFEGEQPAEVAEEARSILEAVRAVVGPRKALSRDRGRNSEN